MHWKVLDRLETIPASHWNHLVGHQNPFLRHEFLAGLERHGCVGESLGWQPRHLAVYLEDRLVGALPQYRKHNSYGEFVFDWSWADAYARAGLQYYPKLVVAIPYTPVAGPRLCIDPEVSPTLAEEVRDLLIQRSLEYLPHEKASSLHYLFTCPEDTHRLAQRGFLIRQGYQYHWYNRGYRDFDDFLSQLTSKRRRQIQRERREVVQAGIEIEILTGTEIDERQWQAFYHFYRSTFERKWGWATLTPGFFQEIGSTLAESVVLVMARRQGRYVAGAFALRGPDTLYGRHWGASEYHPGLHFEVCYYQTIDYCIGHRLARFEAGAQGEHKVPRGFEPVPTFSGHWIAHEGFRAAIGKFLAAEREAVEEHIAEAGLHLPFSSRTP